MDFQISVDSNDEPNKGSIDMDNAELILTEQSMLSDMSAEDNSLLTPSQSNHGPSSTMITMELPMPSVSMSPSPSEDDNYEPSPRQNQNDEELKSMLKTPTAIQPLPESEELKSTEFKESTSFVLLDDMMDEHEIAKKYNFPIVDHLQPDELCLSINETIQKMSQLDTTKDALVIMAYKKNLIAQLEKLQMIRKAIENLNDMEKTAENLPKNKATGYPDINAIHLALREHSFFAEQVNVFGMLLIEISDYNKISEQFSSEYTNGLIIKICDEIESEFDYQHLLFHYSTKRLVVLVYIENESELIFYGKEIIRILTAHSFEVKDQLLHSSISVGAAIFDKKLKKQRDVCLPEENEENEFDFRTWLKNAELSLNKANESGLINQCCIYKENDTIRAIVPSLNVSDSKKSQKQHQKSTLSLLARGARTHSSGGSTYNKLRLAETTNNLSPKEIRASVRLYDKLRNLKIKGEDDKDGNGNNKKGQTYLTRDNYKLVALSIVNRLKDQGANYNFQHPKYNGNSILMLCVQKNFDIIIKYFCKKLYKEIEFNAVNNDGHNALMLAILNKNVSDDIVKLIAQQTKDKSALNNEGKSALQLAQQMARTEVVAMLQ